MKLASLACALAACSSGKGAYVTVSVGTTSADQVALYVGSGDETQQIDPFSNANVGSGSEVPPLAFGSGSGTGASYEVDTFDPVTVADGRARFHLDAVTAGTVVQLIAIGAASDPTNPVAAAHVYDLSVPVDHAVDVDMTLEPVMPATLTSELAHPHSAELAKVWQSSYGTCAMLEDWDADATAARMMIVPSQDPDCDGFPTGDPAECKPLWFDFEAQRDDFADASCATTTTTGPTGTCYLGVNNCHDGTPGGTCLPITQPSTCMPSGACSSASCAQPDMTTPPTSFRMCAGSTFIHCSVATALGAQCDKTLFGSGRSDYGVADLTLHSDGTSNQLFGNGPGCQSLWSQAQDTFAMPVMGPTGQVVADGVTLTFATDTIQSVCAFDVTWTTGVFQQLDVVTQQLAAVQLSNGTQLMVPLVVEQTQCPAAGTANAISCGFDVATGELGFTGCLQHP